MMTGLGHTHSAAAQTAPAITPEFVLYTFMPCPAGTEKWQKHDVLTDAAHALHQARSLFASGQFSRVVIKAKARDTRTGTLIEKTVKTFSHKRAFSLREKILAALCGFAALLACIFAA